MKLKWQENMFGEREKTAGSSYLGTYIDRTNPDKKRECDPFGLKVRTSQLPPECIRIFLGENELKEFKEVEELSEKLCKKWKGKQNLRLWPEVEPKAKTIKAKSIARTNSSKKADASTPPPERKSLTEFFRCSTAPDTPSISVTSIISHITAAVIPTRKQDDIEKSLAEILSPDCINVIAERIVDGSINEFCDFFYAEYDLPPNIKKSVAAVIASNKDLRAKLAAKVAGCGYLDMLSWFQAFSFFCEKQIVVEVEYALNAAAEEPGFKEKFLLYAPEQLPKLIKIFSDYGCVVAVRLFKKINQEGGKEARRIKRLLYGRDGINK